MKNNAVVSKILIFSKGRLTGELQFRYDDKSIETVTNFNYLGITQSRTGSFKTAMHKLAEKEEDCIIYQYSVILIYLIHSVIRM